MSNKAALVLLFEQGDVPTGANFADLINSCVNMNETAVQALLGPLNPTELITPRVSATSVNITGVMSAASISITNVSADVIYTSALRTNEIIGNVGVVSAAGTTQATGALLSFTVNRGKGIVDGSTTGYRVPANKAGLVQYLFNEGASANLWPVTGGTINGLAANAAFPLATSAMVTIVHLTASACSVK